MSTQFTCQKHFYSQLFKQLYITIQFSQAILIQLNQFSKCTDFFLQSYMSEQFC